MGGGRNGREIKSSETCFSLLPLPFPLPLFGMSAPLAVDASNLARLSPCKVYRSGIYSLLEPFESKSITSPLLVVGEVGLELTRNVRIVCR